MVLLHFVTLAEPAASLLSIDNADHGPNISKFRGVRYETFACTTQAGRWGVDLVRQ
ncbi:hypothetical protein [Azospirillum palustre]